MGFDWSNATEITLETALGLVPEAGDILSALVAIFWPQTGEDVWAEVQLEVETLIRQDLDQYTEQQVTDDLQGLKNVLCDYLTALPGSANLVAPTWVAAREAFSDAAPHFQQKGREVLLLPLFAQFANLELALLRDGILYGPGWGFNQTDLNGIHDKLTQKIQAYAAYATAHYRNGHLAAYAGAGVNYNKNEPFLSANQYARAMTLQVLDFAQMWPYFDPIQYPNPVSIYLDREIYSDPQGTCDNSGNIVLPSAPTQPISQITVWYNGYVDSVQVTYPPGGGPGGVTKTAKMGGPGNGISTPKVRSIDVSSGNPITIGGGNSGDILDGLKFTFQDGTDSGQLAGHTGSAFAYSYPGEIVSSIHVNGKSDFYGTADCVVYGFKYAQSQVANADGVRRLYIASPSHKSVEDLVARSARTADAAALSAQAKAEKWDADRQQHWGHLKALARQAQHA